MMLLALVFVAGCRAKGAAEQPPPASQEMKVQETPVASIYEEKGGVLYERPERPKVTPTPTPSPSAPTPSPTRREKG